MRLKSAFAGLASLVLGLSLSPAFAATLTVDNFNDMGTVPTTGNQWAYTAASGVITGGGVGARQLDKNNGSAFAWGKLTSPGALNMTSTGTGNSINMRYDGTASTSSSGVFPSPPDFSAFTYLNVLAPSVPANGSTNAIATIQWASSPGGVQQTSTLTLTGGTIANGYSFKLADFSAPITGPSFLRCLTVRLEGLGVGTTTVDAIYFATEAVPEPGTLVLAGLGLVGLVIARRKKSA